MQILAARTPMFCKGERAVVVDSGFCYNFRIGALFFYQGGGMERECWRARHGTRRD